MGRLLNGARLLALLAVVTLTAGPVMTLDAGPAASESDGPTGYTTLVHGSDLAFETCQLAKIGDLGEGGTVTPIGPSFRGATDGCPADVAIRNEDDDDPPIWAVIEHGFFASSSSAGLPGLGALDADGLVSALAIGDPSVLVTIDPETGVRTTIGSLGFASVLGALAFDAEGTLWFYTITNSPQCPPGPDAQPGDNRGQCLYRLDPHTGAATLVAHGPTISTTSGQLTILELGATASCEHVYANVVRGPNDSPDELVQALNRVNTRTGALTPRPTNYPGGPFSGFGMFAIEHSGESDKLWGIARTFPPVTPDLKWGTYRVDPETGAATKTADLTMNPDDRLNGLAISGLSCDEDPEAPPATGPPVVVAEPSFTG